MAKKLLKCFRCFIMLIAVLVLSGCKDNVYSASQNGKVEVLKKLISEGSDINKKNRKGQLPIFLAIQNDHFSIVTLLVENGADLTIQDQYAGAPLHNAAFMGNIDIARLLIGAGADVNAISNRNEYTPICYAVIEGKVEMIKFLIENGANLDIKLSYYEETLLHLSIGNISNAVESSAVLLEAGMNINARNKDGKTPLHLLAASIWTGPEIAARAKFLLENGAASNAIDNENKRAIDYAIQKQKVELIKVLEDWDR